MAQVSTASDLMMKVDTDEFLALIPDTDSCSIDEGGASQGVCQLTPHGVSEYLNDVVASMLDGSILRLGFQSKSIPDRERCEHSSTRRSTTESIDIMYGSVKFQSPAKTMKKSIFDSRTFRAVDLGGHLGEAWQPFNHGERAPLVTRLSIFHLHSVCYDIEQQNNEKAVISHKYLSPGNNKTERIQRLYEKLKLTPCNDGTPKSCCDYIDTANCGFNSCHKVKGYLRNLVCAEDDAEHYWETYRSQIGYENREFQDYLESSLLHYWQENNTLSWYRK
jgi:hypothetical protein